MSPGARDVAAAAAALIADEGLEYPAAKKKAARTLGHRGELPSNEQVEDALREHLAVYHADTQPDELRALRRLALRWMRRLARFRPHLGGAAWRGTATRHSALHLDLYCDDPKAAEIALLDDGLDFDAQPVGHGDDAVDVLTVADRVPGWGEPVTLHLWVRDLDALRGALKPDARGRSWRGDTAALERLLAEGEAP